MARRGKGGGKGKGDKGKDYGKKGGKPKGGNVRSLCLHRKLFSKNFKPIKDLSDTRARLQRHWLVLILSFTLYVAAICALPDLGR